MKRLLMTHGPHAACQMLSAFKYIEAQSCLGFVCDEIYTWNIYMNMFEYTRLFVSQQCA